MSIDVFYKENQCYGEFNDGDIVENKPIGFPQDKGKLKPYSNLFYWANAFSEVGSTIGMHAHQGFEIFSYLIRGSIEHFDSKSKTWNKLHAGDAQVIKSGSGISHSERFHPGTQIFQIWFNPDLKKTLTLPAIYTDFNSDLFHVIEAQKRIIKTIVGSGSPIELDSYGLRIKEITFFAGNHFLALEPTSYYSIYCIKGSIEMSSHSIGDDDFMLVYEELSLDITAATDTKVFIIESPESLSYLTYFQMYPQKYT
ncbi:MAG: pirin family protein [Candidatus Kapabacteria bacterium]|nr:pirin family protein [Candidatus Kapabacteria bacterium]